MTNLTPTPGHAPALPCRGIEQAKARIAQHCEWFDLQQPKLRTRRGELVMTDELFTWFHTSGASIDWIVLGDAKGLAASFRNQLAQEREFVVAVRKFDDTERAMLMLAMRAIIEKTASDETVKAVFLEALSEKRGTTARPEQVVS